MPERVTYPSVDPARGKRDVASSESVEEKYEHRASRMVNRWISAQPGSAPQQSQAAKQTGQSDQKQDTETEARSHQVRITQNRASSAFQRVSRLSQHVVIEQPREVPVMAECEVLVVGGGPAGLSAALAARRAGADVVLCERFSCFGGVITTVGMETLGWYRYEGTVESANGIGREMERVAERMGGTTKWPYNDSPCLDADAFKIVADRLVQDAGIRPLLHSMVVEAMVENGVMQGVFTESKSGRKAILARCVIDCTGDADVAHLAGADYTVCQKEESLGATSVFAAAGVEKDKFLQYTERNPRTYKDWSRTWQQEGDGSGKEDDLRSPYLDLEFEDARNEGIIPDNEVTREFSGSWSALTDAGEATNLNLVHLKGVDVTDVEDLTRAEMLGRSETLHALQALRAKVPGFQHAKLRNFGMTLGTRDSRKIVGRCNLTGHDVRHQARFEDSIGIYPEFVDGYSILILPTSGRYFQVPYGCMVPPKVDNLLVAGRCVAGDKISHAATRNMMCCTITGQGAGVAAAIAVRNNVSTHAVDVSKVQEELRRQGVQLA